MSQDADQARRLQALLAFKEQFISETMAAQVIGSSGSELSRSVYIDKGEKDGLKPDMAVITADGVVGKVLRVYRSTSLVLLIDDQTSGVGAILDKTRLQGIVRGTPSGEVVLEKVMSDETVPAQTGAARAVDILAGRLPSVPSKPENAVKASVPGTVVPGTTAPGTAARGAAAPGAGKPGTVTTTVAPANSASDVKLKVALPQVSASGGASAVRKAPNAASLPSPASSPSPGAASGTSPAAASATKATGDVPIKVPPLKVSSVKVTPKPVTEAIEPKAQPPAGDSPH